MAATSARARAAAAGASASSPTRDLALHADALDAAVGRLAAVTRTLQAVTAPTLRLANAATYLEAFGHVVAAWIWLEQTLAASDHEGQFYDGKRQACRWFYRCELPRTAPQFDLLERVDDTALAMRDEWY
jgi:Acetyl-CoA dehydrogenase C-terminal like